MTDKDPVLYEIFNTILKKPTITKVHLGKLLKVAEIALIDTDYKEDTFLVIQPNSYTLNIPKGISPYTRLYYYLYAYLIKKYVNSPFIYFRLDKLKLNESIENKIKEELFYGLEEYSFENIIRAITSEKFNNFINNKYAHLNLTKSSMQFLEEYTNIFNILCKNYVNPEQLFR